MGDHEGNVRNLIFNTQSNMRGDSKKKTQCFQRDIDLSKSNSNMGGKQMHEHITLTYNAIVDKVLSYDEAEKLE